VGRELFDGLARAQEWWQKTIWSGDKRGLAPPDIALGLQLTSRALPPDIAHPPELQLLLRLAAILAAARAPSDIAARAPPDTTARAPPDIAPPLNELLLDCSSLPVGKQGNV
jgi:hypothetical protein